MWNSGSQETEKGDDFFNLEGWNSGTEREVRLAVVVSSVPEFQINSI
jgi:hypothetical protein